MQNYVISLNSWIELTYILLMNSHDAFTSISEANFHEQTFPETSVFTQ